MYCDSENIIWTVTDILNLRCDLEHSNPNFSQDTPTYDAVLSNQVWLQMDQQFRRYSKKIVIFVYISPHCDLDIQDSEQIFPRDTLAHNNAPPYQIWSKWLSNTGDIERTCSDT